MKKNHIVAGKPKGSISLTCRIHSVANQRGRECWVAMRSSGSIDHVTRPSGPTIADKARASSGSATTAHHRGRTSGCRSAWLEHQNPTHLKDVHAAS